MCVVLKPVFESDFHYDEQSVIDYVPKLGGYVPAAQIQLTIEDNQNERRTLAFQLDEDILDRFLSDLLALQKEMKSMSDIVGKLPVD